MRFSGSAYLVGAIAGIGLTASAVPVQAADIVLGLSFGKTGLYSTINKTTEIAVDIAAAEINAAGGINGKKLRIVKFDTAGDPKQAVVAVRKFARDDGALGVIGPFSSSEARVAFAAGEREKIVQIPNASSAPKLADKFSYAYRLTESEYLQFIRVVKTMKKRNALKKSVAIMYGTDDVVSKAVGLFIMKPILTKEKIKITGPIGFATKAFDLSPQVSQLKGKAIDYVGLAGITPVAIRVLKEMRRQNINVPIIGAQIWADPEIVNGMGTDGEDSVFAAPFYYDLNDRTRDFTRKFVAGAKAQGIHKPWPHHVDASAYDIVYVFKKAMEVAKITGDPKKLKAERTAIRDVLGKISYDLVQGKVCFEKNGDAQLPGYIMTMKNKKWKLLDSHPAIPCKM
ncbi:MAG: ABC transporter substrate-binding protein [Rhodospirillaceae bacterium]|jgi:branched-chain amino acid transport system substrate-binding protein|nr:ABC transporter substrate-binding protein [Rhodospirillaceae bacterium]